MCFTLSQPSERPSLESIGPALPRALVLCGLLILIPIASACDRVETRSEPSVDTAIATAFEWPDDPSHPRLLLEIESDSSRVRGMKRGVLAIEIELMPELAPITVAHVIELAKDGYYDGTTFHRVIPGFMIQGGDPNSRDSDPDNDGKGDISIKFDDEFSDAPFLRGVVGMGNKGRQNSTGSQFFIMHADDHSLDGRYTVIGRVVSGIEIVDSITEVSIDRIGRWGPKNRPIENVFMKRVAIRKESAKIGSDPSIPLKASRMLEEPDAKS